MFENIVDILDESKIEEFYRQDRLPNGLYIRINKDNTVKSLYVDDKIDEIENLELINWFKDRLRYSSQLEANKSINQSGLMNKTNISCNYLSIIFNMNTFIGKRLKVKELNNSSIHELFKRIVEEHYSIGINKTIKNKSLKVIPDSLKNKEQSFQLYFKEEYDLLFKSDERNNDIIKAKQYFENNLEKLGDLISEYTDKKVKISIFLDRNVELFKREYGLYMLSNISLSNDYNILRDGKIYIPLAIQNSYDSKKPLLKFYNSKNLEIPNYIELKKGLLLLDINRFILKNNIINTDNGQIKLTINESDITNLDRFNFKVSENRKIELFDFIGYKEPHNVKVEYLWKKVNGIIGNNKESYNINDFGNREKSFLYMYKDIINNYVFNNIDKPFIRNIEKIFNNLLNIVILKDDVVMLEDMLNLELSLYKKYGIDKYRGMEFMIEEVIKIAKQDRDIESDKEAMFVIGQFISYLLSNTSAKKENRFNQKSKYINASSVDKLMDLVHKDLSKYASNIIENKVFNRISEQIFSYEFKNRKITTEYRNNLLFGMLNSRNVLFIKKEEMEKGE